MAPVSITEGLNLVNLDDDDDDDDNDDDDDMITYR